MPGLPGSGSTSTLLLREKPESPDGRTNGSAPPSATAGTSRVPRRRRGLLRLISPLVVLLLWQGESAIGLVSTQKLPPPTEIWSTAVSLVTTDSPAYGTLQGAMLVSLERVAIGFSLGAAWLALVVAEQINASAGLGYMINQAEQFDRNDVIFVCLLVYCVLGLLTDALVRFLERRALAWRRGFLEQ
jgi:ABC-type nitrate/sulfonate/bicarbonate transport system permease component